MAKRDYYKVLGVEKNATNDDIRQAYRTLAKKYHPDISKEPDAEEKFKEVQEAYACLSDEEKRNSYDMYGHSGVNFGGQDFSNFGSYQDIINEFFSSFGFGGSFGSRSSQSRNPNQARDGEDRLMEMTITFDEAVHGCKKSISINKSTLCPTCSGSGAASKTDIKACPKCRGTGYVTMLQNSIFGQIQTQMICPGCKGAGKIITEKCKTCKGTKKHNTTKNIDITIPAGIDNGTHLRVRGYGDDGINGGRSGDLFIKFSVQPSSKFERKGSDIYSYLSISMSQAVLGDKIEIQTIHGSISYQIPPGLKSGTVLKITGKGIKTPKETKPGDHYLVVNIITPKNLSSEQKQLYIRLGELDGSMPKDKSK